MFQNLVSHQDTTAVYTRALLQINANTWVD